MNPFFHFARWRSDRRWRSAVARAHSFFRTRQAATYSSHGLDFSCQYAWNTDEGVITFSRNGQPFAAASILVVGSVAGAPPTWLWGWANDTYPARLTAPLLAVRKYGTQQEFRRLVEPQWQPRDNDPHDVTVVSGHFLGAEAFFHDHDEHNRGFFFLLRDLRPV